MTTTACTHCASHHFETQSLEFPGSTLTISVVSCAQYGVAVGIVGEHDVARKLFSIEHNVMMIAAILDQMSSETPVMITR
jgi:hypothetical protein